MIWNTIRKIVILTNIANNNLKIIIKKVNSLKRKEINIQTVFNIIITINNSYINFFL